jgi:hypothetical protein
MFDNLWQALWERGIERAGVPILAVSELNTSAKMMAPDFLHAANAR